MVLTLRLSTQLLICHTNVPKQTMKSVFLHCSGSVISPAIVPVPSALSENGEEDSEIMGRQDPEERRQIRHKYRAILLEADGEWARKRKAEEKKKKRLSIR